MMETSSVYLEVNQILGSATPSLGSALCPWLGGTGTASLPSAQAPEGLPVQYGSISSFKDLKYLKM